MVFTSILSPICLLRSALVVFSAGFFAQTVRLFACRFKLLLLNATNYGIETSYTFSEQTSPVYYDPDKNKLCQWTFQKYKGQSSSCLRVHILL